MNEVKPIPLRIKLPYGTEEEFIERYGSNVARGGIFVATRSLKPEGTAIGFEFVLASGARLLRGEAVVVKAQVDEGGQRAGMTLRFTRLDAASKALIDRVVELRGPPPAEAPQAKASKDGDSKPAVPPGLISRVRGAPAPERTGSAPVAPTARGEAPPAARAQPAPAPERVSAPIARAGQPSSPERHATEPTASSERDEAATSPLAVAPASERTAPAARGEAPPALSSAPATAPAPKRASSTPATPATQGEASPASSSPATAAPDHFGAAQAAAQVPAADRPERGEAAPPASSSTAAATPDHFGAAQAAPAQVPAADRPERGEAPPASSSPAAAAPDHFGAAQTAPAQAPAADHPERSEPPPAAAPASSAPEPGEPEPAWATRPERQPVLIRSEDIAPPPPAPKRRRSVPDLDIPKPAVSERAAELVLGIDLGTTNSRVAVFKDGAPRLVPLDLEGRSFALPSLVALDREAGTLVVGERARDAMVRDPGCAVFAAKRLIGQRVRSPNVKSRAERLPFTVVPDRSGDAAVRFGDNVYSMAELSSVLIKELKDAASRHLGHPVKRAVICVPAYFTDHQRTAMLEAAKLAGLEVLRIFNEPTSVSLAFGYGRALPRKRILVYDLGGGTFGASVVEVTGDDLEVVATGGDNFLGGMDFDERVAAELSGRFEQREQRKLDATPIGQQRLRDAAERAKIALSEQASADVHLAGAAIGADGGTVDLKDELSRDRLEALTAELVERTIEVTRSVLASAGLTAEKLDEVLLVGGQSRAPLVRRRVQELCGRPPRTDVDAQAAVALGAAILGHALDEAARGKPGVTLSEVLSAPVAIGVRGGGVQRVFERNTRLPAEKTVSFGVSEGQSVGIAVFQGAGMRAEENEYLGCIEAPADRAGEVTLHFALSADGTLDLTAISPAGRREVARMSTADATDEARAAMLAASPLGDPNEPRPGLLRKGLKRILGR